MKSRVVPDQSMRTASMNYKTEPLVVVRLGDRIYAFADDPNSSRLAGVYGFLLEVASLFSCLLLILRTFDGPIHGGYQPEFPDLDPEFFRVTDMLLTILFTWDFVLRLVTCPLYWNGDAGDNEGTGRMMESSVSLPSVDPNTSVQPFFKSWYNLFDLASILPFYIDTIFGQLTIISLLRLCRMLRILKMTRHFSGTYILVNAIRKSVPPIKVFVIFLIIIILIFGTFMYLADPCYDKNICSFTDIFNGAYFILVTVTTVGYGDMVPVEGNMLARSATVIIMVIGSLFLAMPLFIVGTEFDHAWRAHIHANNAAANGDYRNPNNAIACLRYNGCHRDVSLASNASSKKNRMSAAPNLSAKFDSMRRSPSPTKANANDDSSAPSKRTRSSLFDAMEHRPRQEKLFMMPSATGCQDDISLKDVLGLKPFARTKAEILTKFDDSSEVYLLFCTSINMASHTLQSIEAELKVSEETQIDVDTINEHLAVLRRQIKTCNTKRNELQVLLNNLVEHGDGNTKVLTNKRSSGKIRHSISKSFRGLRDSFAIQPTTANNNSKEEYYSKILLHFKKQNLPYKIEDVVRAHESDKFRDKLWLVMEVPPSCQLARIVAKILLWGLIWSMMVTVGETMPEFQKFGESSYFCQEVVQSYCTPLYSNEDQVKTHALDPGCYVYQENATVASAPIPLRFDCGAFGLNESNCFGVGLNFGSLDAKAYTCHRTSASPIIPFQTKAQLLRAKETRHALCDRLQCDDDSVTYIDMAKYWVFSEWVFAILFTLEQLASFLIAKSTKEFFSDMVVWIDLVSMAPFYYLEYNRITNPAIDSVYAIPPGSNDLFTIFRLLRVTRVLKFYRNMPGTHILSEAVQKCAKKLMIPYFVLGITAVIFSFLLFELEQGVPCFAGRECSMNDAKVSYPPEMDDYVIDKRVLFNEKGLPSQFKDFFSSFWFTMAAISSVGYGDITPVTQAGKFVTVLAMLFGACYTAMPLTMMGGQFYACYKSQQRREALAEKEHMADVRIRLGQKDAVNWSKYCASQSTLDSHVHKAELANSIDELSRLYEEDDIDPDEVEQAEIALKRKIKLISIDFQVTRKQVLQLSRIMQLIRRRGAQIAWDQRETVASLHGS